MQTSLSGGGTNSITWWDNRRVCVSSSFPPAWFPLPLLFCSTVILLLYLPTCPFYLTDLVSYRRQSQPPSTPPSTASALVPTSLRPLQNIFLPISLHIIFSCLQRNRDSWLSFIPLIHGVAGANLQGTRQRLFVKLLFISFIKSSSSPIKEPRTVALDWHITLVSFGEMIYCLI